MKIPDVLVRLGGKVFGPLKEPVARAIYSNFMQSPTGKRLQTWVPLIASTGVLGIYVAKMFGWGGAESALHWLEVLGIKPGISEAELAIAAGLAAGLFRKYAGMILAAKGEVVPPNNLPFDEARNLALRGVIAANAPVAAPAKAEMKAEAKAETKAAVDDVTKE